MSLIQSTTDTKTLTSRIVSLVATLYSETKEATDGQSRATIGRLLYEIKEHPDVAAHTELTEALEAAIRLMFSESPEDDGTASEWAEGLAAIPNPDYVDYTVKEILDATQKAHWYAFDITFKRSAGYVITVTHPEDFANWGCFLAQILTDEAVPEETKAKLREAVEVAQVEADENLSRAIENFFREKCMESSAEDDGQSEKQTSPSCIIESDDPDYPRWATALAEMTGVDADLPESVKSLVWQIGAETARTKHPFGKALKAAARREDEKLEQEIAEDYLERRGKFYELRERVHAKVMQRDTTNDQLAAMIRAHEPDPLSVFGEALAGLIKSDAFDALKAEFRNTILDWMNELQMEYGSNALQARYYLPAILRAANKK